MIATDSLERVGADVVSCNRCPRLRRYCEKIAKTKRRAYRDETYWGKPVPGFGDPRARLLIVGLAPGAHGANRTGRMFTGDGSGDFLFAALHRAGFCNQPTSASAEDGLRLLDAYVTAVARCAPPKNRPHPEEIRRCRLFLSREMDDLPRIRAVLVLGRVALDGFRAMLHGHGFNLRRSAVPFSHGGTFDVGADVPRIFIAFHPSRQNTQTGRVTPVMMDDVLSNIRRYLDAVDKNRFSRKADQR